MTKRSCNQVSLSASADGLSRASRPTRRRGRALLFVLSGVIVIGLAQGTVVRAGDRPDWLRLDKSKDDKAPKKTVKKTLKNAPVRRPYIVHSPVRRKTKVINNRRGLGDRAWDVSKQQRGVPAKTKQLTYRPWYDRRDDTNVTRKKLSWIEQMKKDWEDFCARLRQGWTGEPERSSNIVKTMPRLPSNIKRSQSILPSNIKKTKRNLPSNIVKK